MIPLSMFAYTYCKFNQMIQLTFNRRYNVREAREKKRYTHARARTHAHTFTAVYFNGSYTYYKIFLSNIICVGFSFYSACVLSSFIHSVMNIFILKQWQQQYINHFCLHHCFYFILLFVYNIYMNAYCGGNTTC